MNASLRDLLTRWSPVPKELLAYAGALAEGLRRLVVALGPALTGTLDERQVAELRAVFDALGRDGAGARHPSRLLERRLDLDPVVGFGTTARLVAAWYGAVGRVQEDLAQLERFLDALLTLGGRSGAG
jgi:hypothetical protein